VKGGLFLNVVVRKSSSIFKLFSSENESLLLWRDSFFVLDLGFDVLDRVIRLDVQSDRFASQSLHENLHGTTTKSEDKVKGGLFLDIVVRKSSSIFELFSSENESLLLWRDSFFVLDLGLDVLDSVVWFDIQGDRFSGQSLDKDLHSTTSKTKDKMESRFLLDVIVRKCSTIFQLFSSENESLLLWRNSFLVLNLCFNVLNRVIWFHVQSNRFSG